MQRLWSLATRYKKGVIKLRKWQMALDVLSLPLLTVNLTVPNWLATGGTWVEALQRVVATLSEMSSHDT